MEKKKIHTWKYFAIQNRGEKNIIMMDFIAKKKK